jgi:hypothetical protein
VGAGVGGGVGAGVGGGVGGTVSGATVAFGFGFGVVGFGTRFTVVVGRDVASGSALLVDELHPASANVTAIAIATRTKEVLTRSMVSPTHPWSDNG